MATTGQNFGKGWKIAICLKLKSGDTKAIRVAAPCGNAKIFF
jgi:hypothetical protein